MKKFDYEVIFDANDYKRYEDFFEDISRKLETEKDGDIEEPETLGYSADWLWEFLEGFYYRNMKIKVTLKNFDTKKIDKEKTFDDYQYKIMLRIFNRLAERYPENVVEYVTDEEK